MVGVGADPLRRPALALAAWSGFVWANRANNLRTDDTAGVDLAISLMLLSVSLVFAAATVATVLVAWRRHEPLGARAALLLRGFAVWTAAVWVWRAIDIVADWRSVGFVVVHLVLAVVSWVLAGWAWRATGREIWFLRALSPTGGGDDARKSSNGGASRAG